MKVRQAIVPWVIDRTVIAKSDLAGLPGDQVPLNNNLYVVQPEGLRRPGQGDSGIDFNLEQGEVHPR